jgi:hypothetical protein
MIGGNHVSFHFRPGMKYRPGSELSIAYDENRDKLAPRFPQPLDRGLVGVTRCSGSDGCPANQLLERLSQISDQIIGVLQPN